MTGPEKTAAGGGGASCSRLCILEVSEHDAVAPPPLPKKGGLKCEQLQTRRVDMKRHEEEDLGSVQIPWLAAVSLHAKQWHLKDQKKLHGHARYFSATGKNTQARPSGDSAVPSCEPHARAGRTKFTSENLKPATKPPVDAGF